MEDCLGDDGRDDDEHVVEVGAEGAQVHGVVGPVGLLEDHNDDVVPDVALAVELLGVVLSVGKHRGHVEHDLNLFPLVPICGVHRFC